MRFLIVGAGAIGGYVGAALATSGVPVSFLLRPGTAEQIRAHGLSLTRGGETTTLAQVAVHTHAAEALDEQPDVIVLALKAFDVDGALDTLLAPGRPLPPILSLQNGVDSESLIAARVGGEGVIAGTVTSAVGKRGVGEVVEEKHRGIGIALTHPVAPEVVTALDAAGLSGQGFPAAGPMKWSKLLTNLTGNATSAILDLPVADLLRDKRLYDLEMAMLGECLAVMKALGYPVVDLPGTPVRALAVAARLPRLIAQPVLVKMLGSGRGGKMPSFHIDLHGGRGRTEVNDLNGAVVRHGALHQVPTPVNRVLTETLEALSAGRLPLEQFRHQPQALLDLLVG